MTADHPGDHTAARVVVLAGPSGAGKSRLAQRLHAAHGWPIVRLDDFYRDEDDPAMPRSAELGIVDWDHPDSWNRAAAVDALATLVTTGSVRTPVYDISTSRAVDSTTVEAGAHDLVLAEGIFAAEIIGDLRERGLLAGAYCVHHRPFVTFVRRLARDLRERRKPPWTLVRRGLALMRVEPAVVARQESLGATPARAKDLEPLLAALAR
ncbi:uridine kinase family protein [Phycicoccus sp. Root563]|uniref:uridine kinase family protein n=1 Tax=Phycicoccus sp. Root563 TaxID=1736562 RepID=UPI0007037ABB|nr:AAA family ATPase [Phycicoccus sp. Root563]KQZ90523.1 ATP-binding protein [Phycicoccus sp. Root563]